MNQEDLKNDEGLMNLEPYMAEVIKELKSDRKYSAVHTYNSTLHSFACFSEEKELAMYLSEVFTPARLKDYEIWLSDRRLSWNSISTYMRTLQAVYNRWSPPGSADYNPHLFDDVYTKVEPHTKRALTGKQMARVAYADSETLTETQKRAMAYFMLMFFLRGMPFIDLAHLRKCDVKGNQIVYCRHKTGKSITVTITRDALRLINEYKSKDKKSAYLFPILDEGIKDRWLLYKCYKHALRQFNKTLASLAKKVLPGVKVSSYTARHTWATLVYHMGRPVSIISQSLGHSSMKVTETYLKPFENKELDKVNRQVISLIRKCRQKELGAHNRL